jgi:hypothetical protein
VKEFIHDFSAVPLVRPYPGVDVVQVNGSLENHRPLASRDKILVYIQQIPTILVQTTIPLNLSIFFLVNSIVKKSALTS